MIELRLIGDMAKKEVQLTIRKLRIKITTKFHRPTTKTKIEPSVALRNQVTNKDCIINRAQKFASLTILIR